MNPSSRTSGFQKLIALSTSPSETEFRKAITTPWGALTSLASMVMWLSGRGGKEGRPAASSPSKTGWVTGPVAVGNTWMEGACSFPITHAGWQAFSADNTEISIMRNDLTFISRHLLANPACYCYASFCRIRSPTLPPAFLHDQILFRNMARLRGITSSRSTRSHCTSLFHVIGGR
jgi:hypothetical protein